MVVRPAKNKAKEERDEGNISASPRRVGSTVQEKIEDRSTLAAAVVAPVPLPYNETQPCLSMPRVDRKRRAEDVKGQRMLIRQIILNDGDNDEVGVIAELEDRGA